jgi:hypothetical protein
MRFILLPAIILSTFNLGTLRAFAATVPVIPVPPGYGEYCSVTYPSGEWKFDALREPDGDPCLGIGLSFPGGTVQRAGLWNTAGDNNVMVRCGSDLRLYRAYGDKPIAQASAEAKGKKNCIFIVAPTNLPIFGHPWATWKGQAGPDIDVDLCMSGFNYDVLRQPWDVSMFGQPQDPHTPATEVDRHGRQQPHQGTLDECKHCGNQPPGCTLSKAFENAYDWSMPMGKPFIAVADGLVVDARALDVTPYRVGCPGLKCSCLGNINYQNEIFIEHQVGSGQYAERFVSAYHHMSSMVVHTGEKVSRGQLIGYNGTTGCSGGPHLDLQVFRLTNLSGARSYQFATLPSGSGLDVNGLQGTIDPFGWDAPKHIDPWAWKSLAVPNGPYPVKEPGAFSINLWIPGQAPPTY